MITPFAALEPYKPVAAASFKTVTLSTSTGFTVPPITPSTTYNGAEPAVMELDPLIITLGSAFGLPEEADTITPGALPCSMLLTLLEVTSLNFSPETTDTELDNWEMDLLVYPTTTTSSSADSAVFMVTFNVPLAPITVSTLMKPRKLKTRVPLSAGIFRLYSPFTLVTVPTVVPFN